MSFETEMLRVAQLPVRSYSEFVQGTLFVDFITDEQAATILKNLSAVAKVQMGSVLREHGREFYYDFVE